MPEVDANCWDAELGTVVVVVISIALVGVPKLLLVGTE